MTTASLSRDLDLPDPSVVLERSAEALAAAEVYSGRVRAAVREKVAGQGPVKGAVLTKYQRAVHGLAWVETTVRTLAATLRWASGLAERQQFGMGEELVLRVGFAEYLGQLIGGIPISQSELIRPRDFGLADAADELAAKVAPFLDDEDGGIEARAALTRYLASGHTIADSTGDELLDMVREQFRRFSDDKIAPNAHRWHLADRLIPDELIGELAKLGVFGITIDEAYGGLGLGKLAMCVVTEELSRGWIGAGSLSTRSEIAGDLIGGAGTKAQRDYWLPKIASGEVLPTAVFTEPGSGSDLGSLRTAARRTPVGSWRLFGAKTWITHAARSDLMTVLARTDSSTEGYTGLSMFLAKKTRGTEDDPFPDAGLTGSDIEVLGYRGMREYDLMFDGFEVAADGLLGGVTGEGFKQLMQTFESARIQTAARATGVARSALDRGLAYALERQQFSRPIADFPRVSDKLAVMAAETVMARELTYYAAREKDNGKRSDVEAGMAKLLAARVAWSNADCSLQIHGGLGYALESEISRILCDARILNIFEGAAEIQAQVIGRGLLSGAN
ncbi:acyl-CoA dehydrogenase family protein [Acuticoccus mangrovi]|uniref:Acyl-CoA/acyl-ACP dehydrogenase n=1 Tax=Acuticoccus mangrovi TaxID=2796142 RepID=A0A934IQA7_9HYPH|nr:acyl-CoA dehydrogenase family protein [Acuticoccus mangrovi]MBJ3778112.1 acyl-CoA/acyl-ACP dehydrogenase [Acuticoccus mangrovi]